MLYLICIMFVFFPFLWEKVESTIFCYIEILFLVTVTVTVWCKTITFLLLLMFKQKTSSLFFIFLYWELISNTKSILFFLLGYYTISIYDWYHSTSKILKNTPEFQGGVLFILFQNLMVITDVELLYSEFMSMGLWLSKVKGRKRLLFYDSLKFMWRIQQ